MWVGVPCPRCGNKNCQPTARIDNRGSPDFQVISETVCRDCLKVYDMVKWQIWCFVVDIENERKHIQR